MATQKYVEYYLESIKIDRYVTGAAQPKLNQKLLNTIPIPIPKETSTQSKIVHEILELQTLTQHLESIYQKKLYTLEELKKSLLHEAFNGGL
jgi:type I restriction enzyme S subunit